MRKSRRVVFHIKWYLKKDKNCPLYGITFNPMMQVKFSIFIFLPQFKEVAMHQNQHIVSVSPVQVQDYQQWLAYWLAYQEFYQVQLSEQTTLKTWARFLDQNIKVHAVVARENDQILGFVHYVFHDSTWAINEYCYLEDLFVAPEARGKQVAKQLIEYVQQQAQSRQCARLYWHTQESNLTAQRLYDWVAEKPGVIEYRMPL